MEQNEVEAKLQMVTLFFPVGYVSTEDGSGKNEKRALCFKAFLSFETPDLVSGLVI